MTRLYDATLGQFMQLIRHLADDGNMTAEELAAVLKDPSLATTMLDALRAELTARGARFDELLLSCVAQLDRLREYNAKYWDNRFTDEDFAAVDLQLGQVLANGHTQHLDDLLSYHVTFGSVQETIEMWMRVYKGEFPNAELWETLVFDDEHFRLHKLAASYEPNTITVVRVNLVSHWEPEDGRTVEEVRVKAEAASETLAQLELVSIWGILTELFQKQNGKDLPWTDMAGTEVTVPGSDAWQDCLYVRWRPVFSKAWVLAGWIDYRLQQWSAPVLLGVQS